MAILIPLTPSLITTDVGSTTSITLATVRMADAATLVPVLTAPTSAAPGMMIVAMLNVASPAAAARVGLPLVPGDQTFAGVDHRGLGVAQEVADRARQRIGQHDAPAPRDAHHHGPDRELAEVAPGRPVRRAVEPLPGVGVVAQEQRAEPLDGAPDTADDDAVPDEVPHGVGGLLAAPLGPLDRLAPGGVGSVGDLGDPVAVGVVVGGRLDVTPADDVVDRVGALALRGPQQHHLCVHLVDQGVVLVHRGLVLVPGDLRGRDTGPAVGLLLDPAGDRGDEVLGVGLELGQLGLDRLHLGGVGVQCAAHLAHVGPEGLGVGLDLVHHVEQGAGLGCLVVRGETLPGGEDGSALGADVGTDRLHLVGADLHHVRSQVGAGNR